MSTLTTFTQHNTKHPGLSKEAKKKSKRHQNQYERIKIVSGANDIYVFLKNTSLKILEMINKFSRVVKYKMNIQKYVVFLYNNNKLLEREIKKTISFTIALIIIKYLGINLFNEV